jgi:hypothetical protein
MNKIQLSHTETIEYFSRDTANRVILMYEKVGVKRELLTTEQALARFGRIVMRLDF